MNFGVLADPILFGREIELMELLLTTFFLSEGSA
jgi:hypothetical protein